MFYVKFCIFNEFFFKILIKTNGRYILYETKPPSPSITVPILHLFVSIIIIIVKTPSTPEVDIALTRNNKPNLVYLWK